MTTTQDVAAKIMQHLAKQKAKPNHAFGIHQLRLTLFSNANPKEVDLIPAAVDRLVEQQFITVEDRRGESLVLTEQGYEQLYPLDADAREQLGQLIMSYFAKQHARPSHALDLRNLQFTVIDKLNPKEQALLPEAIEALIEKGWITRESRNGGHLALSQEGYNTLY